MASSTTDLAAWWGAIVATAVLVWDIYKTATRRPVLLVRTENLTSFGREKSQELWIEIANVGNRSTTLTKVYVNSGLGVEEGSDGKRKLVAVNLINAHASTEDRFTLPHKLESGDVWIGTISAKLIHPINGIKTVVIKVVDERGKKTVHEAWIPSDWRDA